MTRRARCERASRDLPRLAGSGVECQKAPMNNRWIRSALVVVPLLTVGVAMTGCASEAAKPDTSATPASTGTTKSSAAANTAKPPVDGKTAAPKAEAVVGKPAPEFALKDLDGKEVKLSDFKGKVVVIEWFNPECPFIKLSHTKGGLVDASKRITSKGAVHLAINSGAPGKQGTGVDKNKAGAKEFSVAAPILLDESGEVGRKYGATNTPHIYIVDKTGTLVYAGGPDNSADAEGLTPEGGTLVNYVDQVLTELDAGKPVSVTSSPAYGCSVKYGS
jgi:peroxiredoxin